MTSVALLAATLAVQAPGPTPPPRGAANPALVARAVRAGQGVVVDGRDLDPVWGEAPVISEFREFTPVEDGDPRFRTEARVAYDQHNLYVFVRMYDPHPDSILSLLARRDIRTASDQIKIIIDGYHDRLSGIELAVNPAGVQRDYAVYNDGNEDGAWDAVWEAATTIDSLGWTAEFRVPWSQLRYTPREENVFGFGIWRDIDRHNERVSWPVYRVSRSGFMSQMGELHGLRGLPTPRRLEVSPYVLARDAGVPAATGGGFDRNRSVDVGADFKYGITSNLTLDATANPDFGQVEADPSVLNLGAFETFYQERRPFFVEGTGVFRFPVNCNVVSCGGEALFYSRRVGRPPQLAGLYADNTSPQRTTILGAGKLTGRLAGGLQLGVLEAVTGRAAGTQDRTIEPLTSFAAIRAQQEMRQGQSAVGLMITAVNRDLDQWTEPYLRRDAYVGAVNVRHRFLDRRYQVTGSFDVSRISGSPQAISSAQRSSVHYYQRPDDDIVFDATRTELVGAAQEIAFGKVGGDRLLFETSYQRRSAGFDVNDLGFLRRADQQAWSSWMGLRWNRPRGIYQRVNWNFNWWQYWTAAGLPQERAANTNIHMQLKSNWWVHLGGTLGQLGATYCDRCARGGPAVRQSAYVAPWAGFEGDGRRQVVPFLFVNFFRADDGRSQSWSLSPSVNLRVSTRVRASLGADWSENTNHTQWYGNFADSASVTHYTFAHLEQHTVALTLRVDYTFTRNLTLQAYAQPFVSKGTYSDVRELDAPRAEAFDDRYQPYGDATVTADPGGFNFKEFRSNLVVRWEYRPGSRIYLVWSQGRSGGAGTEGTRSVVGDFRDLFQLPANNTLMVKASYWLNW